MITFFLSAPRLLGRIACGAAVAAALLGGIAAARASDATMLAGRAGFLLGHALRCGVSDVRLRPSATLIGELIDAYSVDADDHTAAQTELVERLAASASAPRQRDPLPACAVVLGQLARFEQHRPAQADRGAASGPAKPEHAQAAGAVPGLQRAAARPRGRAPSF